MLIFIREKEPNFALKTPLKSVKAIKSINLIELKPMEVKSSWLDLIEVNVLFPKLTEKLNC